MAHRAARSGSSGKIKCVYGRSDDFAQAWSYAMGSSQWDNHARPTVQALFAARQSVLGDCWPKLKV